MSRTILDRRTELRKVGEGDLFRLIASLELDWKRVMGLVPRDPGQVDWDEYEFKYTMNEIHIIEDHVKATGRKATAIFLEEWSTSGRVRPTLETLQKLVTKLKLYGPMLQMAQLLGDPEPKRPEKGPGAIVDTNVTEMLHQESLVNGLKDMATISSNQLTIGATHNNNIDQPHNGVYGMSKVFPNFVQPAALQSTRRIEVSDMMQFSQGVTEDINNPVELLSNELPVMLKQQSFQTALPRISFPEVQSETSESTQNSQDTSDQTSSDMPAIVSSMNRSTDEDRLSGINYRYTDLKRMTRGFDDDSDPSSYVGGLIGKGGFGSVYVGFDSDRQPIAIKRLYVESMDTKMLLRQFQAEIEMTHFHHINLVQVLGYSTDGPEKLIVSEYIHGGNLLKKLSDKTLDEKQRFRIVSGTANGIQYLHYGTEKKMIHKDVKSANILLTEDCIPKLCDFGLTRMQDYKKTKLVGTTVYMAPEVHRQDITPKMDVYSFGIVLLEILTGLQPVISYSPGCTKNIETFVMDELQKIGNTNDITPLLDVKVTSWSLANSLFSLANKCLTERNRRLDSNQVCQYLHAL